LIVDGLSKHFGAQEVLRGARLQIDPGEKLGLVGRNGGGKSTLLRLIEGLERPDGGEIVLRKGARLGHMPQIPRFEPGQSVRAYVEAGLEEARALLRRLEALSHDMASAAGQELERAVAEHQRATERLEALGGWEIDRRVETVLGGIGLGREFWEREARTLSGGERSRVALARELVAGHDLLLLDEPTNHLDLAGIEWLEAWLAEQKASVLIVSHDRRLLNRVVHAIYDLERGQLRRYPGNYERYVTLREERFVSELRAWEQQQEFLRKEEEFIRRHMGSQRTAEAKGRQKKLENVVRLERPYNDVRRPAIPKLVAVRGGELVLQARELAGAYGRLEIFRGANLRIGRGQRIGIVGPNGAGKSTLLKILAGRLDPSQGVLERGHKSLCGFYDQDTSDLDPLATPYETIRKQRAGHTDEEIRSHLARFLFRGEEVDKSNAALSGGERARLSLARLMLEPVSWLAMDEPTNHLDLGARAALEELLGRFDGAIVAVSHDRAFLDLLCTSIVEVDGGRVREFAGNYSQYRDKLRAEAEAKLVLESKAIRPKTARTEEPARQAQAERGEERKPAAGTRIRNPYQFAKLEERIIALEEELKQLQSSMTDAEVYMNPGRMREVQFRAAEVERELAEANDQWANW
jgi:ATP-binding cassette subfamily F protein 3